jgi:hypothetical protein
MTESEGPMSERNGDRARFQKNRKRKLHHRRQLKALLPGTPKKTDNAGAHDASPVTPGEGVPAPIGD